MKTAQEIFDLFKESCKGVVLDKRLKWFCIEVISYRQRKNYKKDEFNAIKPRVDIYLMAELGCGFSAREQAHICEILMGAGEFNVRICPIKNDLIMREGFFFEL